MRTIAKAHAPPTSRPVLMPAHCPVLRRSGPPRTDGRGDAKAGYQARTADCMQRPADSGSDIMTPATDPATLDLMLNELRRPTMRQPAKSLGEQSDHDGGPALRHLAALAEHAPPPNCAPAQPSPASTSVPSRPSPKHRSPPAAPGMPGSVRDHAASPSARPGSARAIGPRPSAGN